MFQSSYFSLELRRRLVGTTRCAGLIEDTEQDVPFPYNFFSHLQRLRKVSVKQQSAINFD